MNICLWTVWWMWFFITSNNKRINQIILSEMCSQVSSHSSLETGACHRGLSLVDTNKRLWLAIKSLRLSFSPRASYLISNVEQRNRRCEHFCSVHPACSDTSSTRRWIKVHLAAALSSCLGRAHLLVDNPTGRENRVCWYFFTDSAETWGNMQRSVKWCDT